MNLDSTYFEAQTRQHAAMVASWRTGHAEPVSSAITDYARYDGIWWRRRGGAWESIPDGPFALSLQAGHRRLQALTGGLDRRPASGRDPWTVARNRMRMGGRCPRAVRV
jgi:hypothetical protein